MRRSGLWTEMLLAPAALLLGLAAAMLGVGPRPAASTCSDLAYRPRRSADDIPLTTGLLRA